MLDDDDVEFTALAFPVTGPISFVLFLITIIIMLVVVSHNKDECAAMHCDNGGQAQLLNHQCLCVEKAK